MGSGGDVPLMRFGPFGGGPQRAPGPSSRGGKVSPEALLSRQGVCWRPVGRPPPPAPPLKALGCPGICEST